MFGDQFYPTPKDVIRTMLAPYLSKENAYKLSDMIILDPSGGKGDLLDFVKEIGKEFNYRYTPKELYTLEIDDNLQSILRDKGYFLIGSDFLKYEQDMYFDLILMNPPFRNGATHLLKAIEIAHDTEIVCLLNAETLLNPNTSERKQLLALIQEFGSFEVLGDVFKDAERTTEVNVALVRLKVKKADAGFDFDFEEREQDSFDFGADFKTDEIARMDVIGNMILQSERAKTAYKEYIKAREKWKHHVRPLVSKGFSDIDGMDNIGLPPLKRYNYFNKRLKMQMWRDVINALDLQRYMTNGVRENFNQFVSDQSNIAFSKENVYHLFNLLVSNSNTILERSIIEVFDMLTENYYSENRMYIEGWKTNDRYKVNRKVIAPMYVRHGEYMSNYDLKQYGDKFALSYHGGHKYSDIDKMLCYISGRKFEEITTIGAALEDHFRVLGKVYVGQKFNNQCSSTFFDIKFYKKGTVHLYFKDKFLWQEFNMRACDQKQWLPDNERSQWQAKKKKRSTAAEQQNKPLAIAEQSQEQTPKPTTPKKAKRSFKNSELSQQLLELFTN